MKMAMIEMARIYLNYNFYENISSKQKGKF